MAEPGSRAARADNLGCAVPAGVIAVDHPSGPHYGATATMPSVRDSLWTINDATVHLATSRRKARTLITPDDCSARVVLGQHTRRWVPQDVRHWVLVRRGELPERCGFTDPSAAGHRGTSMRGHAGTVLPTRRLVAEGIGQAAISSELMAGSGIVRHVVLGTARRTT
jgi:hypothetical protein